MVKIKNIFILFSLVLSITACLPGFKKRTSANTTQHVSQGVLTNGIPVFKYRNGVLEDFSHEHSKWSSSSNKIFFSRIKDTLNIQSKGTGADFASVNFKLITLDFTEGDVIKISARSESNIPAKVKLVLKDIYGKETNAASPTAIVLPGKTYKDYYFNFKEKWRQSVSTNTHVDSSRIYQLVLYINPGGPDYTGSLLIDEISVVKQENIPAYKSQIAGSIFNAKEDISSWWFEKKFSIEKKDSMIVVTADSVGPAHESFGKGIHKMDFKAAGIIRMKAKAQGNKPITLVLNVVDENGHSTNENPVSVKISPDGKFKNYFFNFKYKYRQVWPDTQTVNLQAINSLVAYIDPGKETFSGKIFITEMEVISEKKYKEIQSALKVSKPSESIQMLSAEDGVNEWYTESDKIKVSDKGEISSVELKGVGKLYEHFSLEINPIDLSKSSIIKIKIKMTGDTKAKLRIDLKDKDGFETNAVPAVNVITPGEEFKEYTFDFKGKFEQSYPEAKKVDPSQIEEILFFINPGENPYTGTVLIEKITNLNNEH